MELYQSLMDLLEEHLLWCFEQEERGTNEEWVAAKAADLFARTKAAGFSISKEY